MEQRERHRSFFLDRGGEVEIFLGIELLGMIHGVVVLIETESRGEDGGKKKDEKDDLDPHLRKKGFIPPFKRTHPFIEIHRIGGDPI